MAVLDQAAGNAPLVEGKTSAFTCTAGYVTAMKWYIDDTELQRDVTASTPSAGGTTSEVSFTPSRRHHRRTLKCVAPHAALPRAPNAQVVLNIFCKLQF